MNYTIKVKDSSSLELESLVAFLKEHKIKFELQPVLQKADVSGCGSGSKEPKMIRIADSVPEGWWYAAKQKYEVTSCWYKGQLLGIGGLPNYDPEDYYMVISGEMAGNVIRKSHCR